MLQLSKTVQTLSLSLYLILGAHQCWPVAFQCWLAAYRSSLGVHHRRLKKGWPISRFGTLFLLLQARTRGERGLFVAIDHPCRNRRLLAGF
jgi:hypothetical protein